MLKCLLESSKTDVLLIHPLNDYSSFTKFFRKNISEAPLGLAYLASYLQARGISVEIFDMQIYSQPYNLLTRVLTQCKPKVVGITSHSMNIHKGREAIQMVKEFNCDIVTIIGGLHASALPLETMQTCPALDYLIYGEGELTLYELVNNIINNRDTHNLKGTVVRIDGQIKLNPARELIENVDSLPFAARWKLELNKYRPNSNDYLNFPITSINTIRGCPFHCIFCAAHHIWGSSVRMMSADRVFREILYCIENYNIRDFKFIDDTFTLSKSRVREICNLIIDNKLNISWACCSRVDTVDDELLRLMKAAGCFLVEYGVEVGTQKSLEAISKGTTLQQAKDTIAWTKAADIECYASFMLGVPGETIEDTKKTIEFAKELNPDFAKFRPCFPLPGSELFKTFKEKYNLFPESNWHALINLYPFDPAVFISEFKKDNFLKLLSKAYLSFYLSPGWIIQRIKRFFKNPRREINRFNFEFRGFLRKIR